MLKTSECEEFYTEQIDLPVQAFACRVGWAEVGSDPWYSTIPDVDSEPEARLRYGDEWEFQVGIQQASQNTDIEDVETALSSFDGWCQRARVSGIDADLMRFVLTSLIVSLSHTIPKRVLIALSDPTLATDNAVRSKHRDALICARRIILALRNDQELNQLSAFKAERDALSKTIVLIDQSCELENIPFSDMPPPSDRQKL